MSATIDSRQRELPSAVAWSFLEHLSDGVIIAKTDGHVLYLNQAARTLLSVKPNVSSLTEMAALFEQDKRFNTLSTAPFTARLLDEHNDRVLDVAVAPCLGYTADLIQISISERLGANGVSMAANAPDYQSRPANLHTSFQQQLQPVVDTFQAMGWSQVFLNLSSWIARSGQLITAGFTKSDEAALRDKTAPAESWDALLVGVEKERVPQDSCRLVTADRFWQQLPASMPQQSGQADKWQADDLLCVPLFDRYHRLLGFVGLDQPQNGQRPDANERQTIGIFAQLASNLIENAQLTVTAQKRNEELETLLEVEKLISSSLEIDKVLAHMGQQMQQIAGAQGHLICEWEAEANCLIVQQANVDELGALPVWSPGYNIPLDKHSQAHQLLTSHEPLFMQVEKGTGRQQQADLWLAEEAWASAIVMPIVLSEEAYGLICLYRQTFEALKPQQVQMLQAIAGQAGRALETALIFADTYEREQFYNALGRVSLALNFTLDRKTVLALISGESLRIFGVDAAYIWQAGIDHFIGIAAAGLGQDEFVGTFVERSDKEAFVTQVADQGEATFINHIDQAAQAQFRLPQNESFQSVLAVPFEQEGEILGVLVLADSTQPDRFGDKDITQARIFGAQVAIALQNASLFEELRRFNMELDSRVAERTNALHEESNRVKILLRITSELSASLDQDRVLNQALRLVNEAVNATEGVILLINPDTDELDFRAVLGPEPAPMLHQGIPSGLKRNKGLAGWMIAQKSAVIVPDTYQDSRWIDLPASRNHRSVLGVPLIANEEVIGVLMLFHSETSAFSKQQLDLVEAAAIQVANAISNASLYLLIRDQAESLGTMLLAEQIEAARNQSILESIADGVIVADADGQIILANMAASLILGIPREQLIGKWVNELLGLYSQGEASWKTTVDDWAVNADILEPGTYLADQLVIEDKVVSAHLSPVLAGRQYFGTVSVLRDVTKDAELDRLKSEFVSTVSHELRTPMTSIKGYADLMMKGAAGEMSLEQKRYLKVIKNNADRLQVLVNDLLDISRIETGKTVLDKRPVNINQLVQDVADGHLGARIQLENKLIKVHLEMDPALPLVSADRARITQVLTNLLDNAFNYTPEGGEIRIGSKMLEGFVAIVVSDSGIGISQEIQSKIFERFFRADDSNVQGVAGTGLGLSIVQNLIEMHGGRLELESDLGQGSTFYFTLPAMLEDSNEV